MVAFDRPEYMQHAMLSMLEVHGLDPENGLRYPLYISQDFDHPGVQAVVEAYLGRVRYIQHRETKVPVPDSKREKVAYYRIANHYRFIFRTFFECFGFPRLVILEDDMVVSPDIFTYFHAAGRLLDEDPTLFCVSSWNDHGQSQFVRDTHALHRTDFFPGLGWLTTAPVWRSIEDSWPRAYWDDWMRLNATRRGRQCIRPEVSRTHNFGKVGASGGQFFDTYLKTTALSNESINWDAADLSYLLSDRYAAAVAATVQVAPELPAGDAWDATTGPVKVMYSSQEQYQAITGQYGMMREWKESVPRGAYQGIVRVRNPKGSEVLITPIPGLNLTTMTLTVGNDTFLDATGAVIPKW